MPPQSAPPAVGSQLSLGSSTHLPPPGQGMPAMPPQATGFLSGTQEATGGQGALTQVTCWASQCVPAAQRTVAHGSGAGLHWHVGQPLESSTLPYSQ